MRWDRNYSQPEPINDPTIIPAYGVTDEERAYWNKKQEALEFDDYPHKYGEKILMSGVVWQALEDYKVQAIQVSQQFFWGQAAGLGQIKEDCESARDLAYGYKNDAAGSATAAAGSATDAAGSASSASGYMNTASQYATNAYNSKVAAAASALEASGFAAAAEVNEYDAEAWAKGTRNGEAVPSTDPAYHNNSKYYADQASTIGEVIKDDQTSLYYTWSSSKISTQLSGKANLVNGKVPASELPSYVDDVVEGYYNILDGKFYEESTFETEMTPEAGKIYTDLANDKTYRWGGSAYARLDAGLVLGEIVGTAYEGSKGKANADNIATIQSFIPSGTSTLDPLVKSSQLPVVPTTLASFTDDSTHRLVTDTEKTTWNGKATSGDISAAILAAFNGVTFTKDENDVIYINW